MFTESEKPFSFLSDDVFITEPHAVSVMILDDENNRRAFPLTKEIT
jgi:hypothetical protein